MDLGTSYEVITSVTKDEVMTRIAKGKQTGELWDRVKLENGIVGYVFQNYLEVVTETQVEQINLSLENTTIQKNESVLLKVEILPKEANNQKLTYTSSNPQIVSVDSTGKLLGISSGTAIITAKSKNGVTGTLNVNVYSKVEGLQLREEKLTLQIGEKYNIIPIILPEDANNQKVNYTSENDNIVSVDSSGVITANEAGNTNIKVITQEGNFEKQIDITVIQKIPEGAIIFEENININGDEITGIQPNTTVKEFLEKITTKYTIEIENYLGKKLTENDFLGTGCKVKFLEQNQLIMEFNIILYGDVNGDGKINSVDLLVLQRHILEIKTFSGVFLKAGNTDKSGKRPSSVDLLKIQRHILGLKLIEQT